VDFKILKRLCDVLHHACVHIYDMYNRKSPNAKLKAKETPAFWMKMFISLSYILRNVCTTFDFQKRIRQCKIVLETVLPCVLAIFSVVSKEKESTDHHQMSFPITEEINSLRTGLQFVVNFITGNEENQNDAWAKIFPCVLIELLSKSIDPSITTTVCVLLYNCTVNNEHRRKQLANSSDGQKILSLVLLKVKSEYGSIGDFSNKSLKLECNQIFYWIDLLLQKLFLDNLFPSLHQSYQIQFEKLNANRSTTDASINTTFSEESIVLLKFLDSMLARISDIGEEEPSKDIYKKYHSFLSKELCCYLVKLLRDHYSLAIKVQQPMFMDEYLIRSREMGLFSALEMDSIQLLLEIIGRITCLPISTQSFPPFSVSLNQTIFEEGLLKISIDLLTEDLKVDKPKSPFLFHPIRLESLHWLEESIKYPAVKRDLIRIIGNLCYRNKQCKAQVRDLGGIPLILNYCKLDAYNPYIKEWGIMAIRNICEDDLENQKILNCYKAVCIADNPELKQLGLEAEISSGKIKFKTTKTN